MPEYLSPGVYVEEVSSGAKPIEGVSTTTTGFVGLTERGPTEVRLVTSFLDFERWYGGYIEPAVSYLPYAVNGFFTNGGQRAFVARVAGADAVTAFAKLATMSSATFGVGAVGPGAWGDLVTVEVTEGSQAEGSGADQPFRLVVRYPEGSDVTEQFDNLSAVPGTSNFVVTVVNSQSRLIRVAYDPEDEPARPLDTLARLENGSNGIDPPDFAGDEEAGTGLAGLAAIDEIAILSLPDQANGKYSSLPLDQLLLDQADLLRNRFAVLSAPQGAGEVQDLFPPQDTSYGAFYYPWIRILDPRTNAPLLIPSTGHVCGLYARNDNERGVWHAPANEVLRGLFLSGDTPEDGPLQMLVSQGQQDILNPRGVNVIRDFRGAGRGVRVWGARTMSSDPEWRYVNVRRLFIFVEQSVDQGTQWVVFEPNVPSTWQRVVTSISGFLNQIWLAGGLAGQNAAEAYFVKCDRTTMTQDDIDNGRLVAMVGIAPVKPAEFVIIRIGQKTLEAG